MNLPLPVPLSSTTLASAAYDSQQQVLQLEFRSGAMYQYFDVPESIYQELLLADSHGTYFNYHIRDAFPFLLVRPALP